MNHFLDTVFLVFNFMYNRFQFFRRLSVKITTGQMWRELGVSNLKISTGQVRIVLISITHKFSRIQ